VARLASAKFPDSVSYDGGPSLNHCSPCIRTVKLTAVTLSSVITVTQYTYHCKCALICNNNNNNNNNNADNISYNIQKSVIRR